MADPNKYDSAGGSGDDWGNKKVKVPGVQIYGMPGQQPAYGPAWVQSTVDDAVINFVSSWAIGDPRAQIITNALIQSGQISANDATNITKLESEYRKALVLTAKANETSPGSIDVIKAMQLLGQGTGNGTGSGGTYKDVTRYTDDQVKQKAINAYTSILGTEPSEGDIVEFARALRTAAQAAPSVQKVSANGKSRETTAGFDERAFIAGYMSTKVPDPNADLGGAAGGIQDLIENYKQNYGVNPTAGFIQSAIRNIVKSDDPATAKADLEAQLKEQAQILYPALRDKIQAGLSVRAIADPYISTFSKLMEKSDMSVGLDNSYVSKALSSKNEKGEYQIMDQNEFARQIRSSNEWLDTRNAKETMLSAADGILKQFGFKR